MNKGDFINARKNEDLYVRMMQHIPPPLGLSHTKWKLQRTMTTLRVRHPCRVTTLEVALSLVSAALFVTDIVSDILVLVQLGQAGSEASAALAFGIIFMILPAFVYGYGIFYGLIMKEVLGDDEDCCTRCVLIGFLGPMLIPFAAICGIIFSIGFDFMTVIFPGGRFIQKPLFQRYPKVRKLLESVFEAFPQSILQIIIVSRGFVEDENLGLLTFSIFVSLLSMVKNIFSVYVDSKTYDDMNFVEYVVSIMSATFDQGGSLMKNAAEIRDGMTTDVAWDNMDMDLKLKSQARPTAVQGTEQLKTLQDKYDITEIDMLPEGVPLHPETYTAWHGWWSAQLVGLDRLNSIELPKAFFSARAAHLFAQCIANSQYCETVRLHHCYLAANGQVLMARGLAAATSLNQFETTVDFAAFVAGCIPSPNGGADEASARFWKAVNTAVYRSRVKENRENRSKAGKFWAAVTLKNQREGNPDKLDVAPVVFPGCIPLGSVFVLAGCSALTLFNQAVSISETREAQHQMQRSAESARKQADAEAKKQARRKNKNAEDAVSVTPSTGNAAAADGAVETEEGGQVKGLTGTSERAQSITFLGVTSPGIDLLPPARRAFRVYFDEDTCLRGGVAIEDYVNVCAEAGLDGGFVRQTCMDMCGRMVDSILGWTMLSKTYRPTERCQSKLSIVNVKSSFKQIMQDVAASRHHIAAQHGMTFELQHSDRGFTLVCESEQGAAVWQQGHPPSHVTGAPPAQGGSAAGMHIAVNPVTQHSAEQVSPPAKQQQYLPQGQSPYPGQPPAQQQQQQQQQQYPPQGQSPYPGQPPAQQQQQYPPQGQSPYPGQPPAQQQQQQQQQQQYPPQGQSPYPGQPPAQQQHPSQQQQQYPPQGQSPYPGQPPAQQQQQYPPQGQSPYPGQPPVQRQQQQHPSQQQLQYEQYKSSAVRSGSIAPPGNGNAQQGQPKSAASFAMGM